MTEQDWTRSQAAAAFGDSEASAAPCGRRPFAHWVLLVACHCRVGQGTSYDVSILIVTRGLDPAQQAVMASRYAGVAYSAAPCGVLAAG